MEEAVECLCKGAHHLCQHFRFMVLHFVVAHDPWEYGLGKLKACFEDHLAKTLHRYQSDLDIRGSVKVRKVRSHGHLTLARFTIRFHIHGEMY